MAAIVAPHCFGEARSVPDVAWRGGRRRGRRRGGRASRRAGPGPGARRAGRRAGARRQHPGCPGRGRAVDDLGSSRPPGRRRAASCRGVGPSPLLPPFPPRGRPGHGIARDDLPGRLGAAIFDALVTEGLLLAEPKARGADPVLGAGRALELALTEVGRERLGRLGVAVDPATRRPQLAYCVDWSEQRPHLAGHLGAALLARFVALGWVVRRPRRVVTLTDAGRAGLADQLGVVVD